MQVAREAAREEVGPFGQVKQGPDGQMFFFSPCCVVAKTKIDRKTCKNHAWLHRKMYV